MEDLKIEQHNWKVSITLRERLCIIDIFISIHHVSLTGIVASAPIKKG